MRTREALGYLEPRRDIPDFAQCSSCRLWIKPRLRCQYFGEDKEVLGIDACIQYAPGTPLSDPNAKCTNTFKPSEVGFARGKTRCENCDAFKPKVSVGTRKGCQVFHDLETSLPKVWKLDAKKGVMPK